MHTRRRQYVLLPACVALAAWLTACEQVEVTSASVTTIEVSPSEASVQVNATAKFNATVYGENGVPLSGRQIEWSSLDANVASVNGDGTVRGLAPGTARIRAAAEGATATATVHVTAPPPQIVLSPTSLSFSAQQGGSNPAPRSVQVTGSGSGAVNGLAVQVAYPSGQPSGWATATLSGSAAPTTLSVGVTTGSLAAGTYNATVRVESPVAGNSPQTVQVQFVVEEAQTPDSEPDVPGNVTATAIGPREVRVSWTAPGGQTEHLVRYRGGTGGRWNDPIAVAGNETSYTQTGLSPNSTYQFQVAACNSAGCSQYSSPATVTTLRPADADSVTGFLPPR
jgi:hypothetical protein